MLYPAGEDNKHEPKRQKDIERRTGLSTGPKEDNAEERARSAVTATRARARRAQSVVTTETLRPTAHAQQTQHHHRGAPTDANTNTRTRRWPRSRPAVAQPGGGRTPEAEGYGASAACKSRALRRYHLLLPAVPQDLPGLWSSARPATRCPTRGLRQRGRRRRQDAPRPRRLPPILKK